jgi:hypothetical protein
MPTLDVTSGPRIPAFNVAFGPPEIGRIAFSKPDVTPGRCEIGGIAFSKLDVTSGPFEISLDVTSVPVTSLHDNSDGAECPEHPCSVISRRASSSERGGEGKSHENGRSGLGIFRSRELVGIACQIGITQSLPDLRSLLVRTF